MAVHTWTDGEAITASKLNALEKKRAFIEGTLNMNTVTLAEAIALQEETGFPWNSYINDTANDQYYFQYCGQDFIYSGADETPGTYK